MGGSASTGGGQRLVYRRLEATNMLHRGTVRLHRLHVLVEDGEDLVVEDLVLPDAVRHLLQRLQEKKGEEAVESRKVEKIQKSLLVPAEFTHHILDDLVLAVLSLHFEEMVAEVKEVEAPLLPQQYDDGAASPVQPIAKALSERSRTLELKLLQAVIVKNKKQKENHSNTLSEKTTLKPKNRAFPCFYFLFLNSVSCLRANASQP